MSAKNIAVVGGGINGIMIAWQLLKAGCHVTIYEQGSVMQQTSSASSKLLHGGLRYIEHCQFSMVKEALAERNWWIEQAPHIAHPLQFFIPVYKSYKRPSFLYWLGLFIYDALAGKHRIKRFKKINKTMMKKHCSELKENGLCGGFSYFDGQMDDYTLGMWAVDKVRSFKNCTIKENTEVKKIELDGRVCGSYFDSYFDHIVNASGCYVEHLLTKSGLDSKHSIDLVRGSHIVIDRCITQAYFLEVPSEKRMFFVLPYQNKTMIGTTEMRVTIDDAVVASEEEVDYLIKAFNHYFKKSIDRGAISAVFAGVRPLIKSTKDASLASREYAIEQQGKIISVFGGKWTTSRKLAQLVADRIVTGI